MSRWSRICRNEGRFLGLPCLDISNKQGGWLIQTIGIKHRLHVVVICSTHPLTLEIEEDGITKFVSWGFWSRLGRWRGQGGGDCCCRRPRWWRTSQRLCREFLQSAVPITRLQRTWSTKVEDQVALERNQPFHPSIIDSSTLPNHLNCDPTQL